MEKNLFLDLINWLFILLLLLFKNLNDNINFLFFEIDFSAYLKSFLAYLTIKFLTYLKDFKCFAESAWIIKYVCYIAQGFDP